MPGGNDTRIVQMQFENRDFERNIAKSQKSLEKFKKELNFKETSKGMDKFSKSVKDMDGFESLANNIQKLTDKFTGLGTMSEFVLSRVRRSLEGMGDKVISFANSLTTVQQQAGFVKYESLNKAVQTLKSATGKEESEIYGILERLTKYTDETSYDFSQGVTSISQLVSSGAASLGKAEKVVEGFYNYAAKAGADVTTASHALQFSMTQALQRGFLDWSNAKELNRQSLLTEDFRKTLIETAVELNELTKEGDKYYTSSKKGSKTKKIEVNATNLFNDSLQHQWATTKVLNAALIKYQDTTTEFGAQAYAAAQRCTTFSDALNAWKDMLATGWMQTYRTVFGDLSDAMQLFSGICNKVSDALSELSAARNKLLKNWKGSGGRDSLWGMLVGEFESPDNGTMYEGTKGLLDFITGTGDLMQDAFWDMVKESMSEADRSQLEQWAGNTEALMALMDSQGMLDGANEEELAILRQYIEDNFGERGMLQAYLGTKLAEATKQVQEFVQSINEWFSKTDEKGVTRFEKIKNVVQAIFNTLRFIGEIIGGVFDFLGEIFAEDQLGGAVNSILEFFNTLAKAITGSENDISKSGGITEFFHNLAEAVKPITGLISESIETITEFFTSLISGGEKAEGQTNTWEKINEFFATIASILGNIGQPIIDTIKQIFTALFTGEKKSDDGEGHISFFQVLLDILLKVSEVVGKVIGFVGDLVAGFIAWGKESGTFTKVWETIKSVVSSVWETLKTIAAPFKEFFGSIGEILKDLFSNGFSSESLARAGEGFKQAFGRLFGNLDEMIDPIAEKIKAFFQKVFGIFHSETEEGVEDGGPFRKIVQWIKTGFGKIPEAINELASSFKQSKSVVTLFDGVLIVLDELKQLFIKFRDHFGFTNTEAALIIGSIVGLVVLIVKITKAVRRLGEGMSTLGSAMKKFSLLGGEKTESPGDKMLKTAIGLAIIAAAIVVLGKMPWKEAVQGLVAMGAIMVAMGFFVKVMAKSIKNLDWKATGMMALALISLGTAISKMVPMLKLLGGMNPTEYQRAILGFLTVLGAIGAFFFAAGKLDINFKKLSGMIPMAIAIWMLVRILSKVADMDLEKIKRMGYSLAAIMGSLFLVGLSVGRAPAKTFRDIGLMIAAISLLIFSLKGLAKASEEDFQHMAVGFGGLILGLLILTAGIALINRKIGGMSDAGLKELAYAAAAMALLVFALKPLADMNDMQLTRMGASFSALVAGLLVLTAGLAAINKKTFGIGDMGLKQLLWAALGMFAIIMALKPVADMEWGQLGRMGAVFGGIIAGLLVLIGGLRLIESKLGGGMKKSISFAALLSLVLGIVALIEVLKPVGEMDDAKLQKMGLAFSVLVSGLAVAIGIIQGTASGFGKALGSIVVIAALVGAMSRIIKIMTPLGEMDDGKLIKMGVSFAAIIAGLAITMGMAAKLSKLGKKGMVGIGMMLTFAAAMAVFALSLRAVKDISWQQMIAFAGGFSLMLGVLALAVIGLSKVDLTAGIKGIFLLAAAVAAILGVISLMAPLVGKSLGRGISNLMGELAIIRDDISDFVGVMNGINTDNLLTKAKALVDTVKEFAGAASYKEDVYSFADQVFTLGAGLHLFDYSTKEIGDPEGSNAFKLLEKLTGLKESLRGMDILSSAALNIAELGAGLWVFNDLGGDVPEGADDTPALNLLTKLADSASGLTTISELPLSQLGDQLGKLGGALMLYAMGAAEVADIESKGDGYVPDVSKASEFLHQVIQQLGGEEMKIELPTLPDETTISGFGSELAALAGALKKFITESNGINGNTQKGLSAIGFLADIRSQMTDDAIQAVTYFGEKGINMFTLAKFGMEMVVLASGLSAFIKASNGVTGKTQKGLDAIQFLADIRESFVNNKLENLQFIKEFDLKAEDLTDDDFKQFGLQIEKLGEALGSFEGHVEFTAEQAAAFGSGIEALKTFVALQNEMPKTKGLKPWLEGYAGTLGELAPDIRHLGTSLKDFSDALTADQGFDAVQVEAAVNSFAVIVGTFSTLVEIMQRIQEMTGKVSQLGISGGIDNLYGNLLVYLGYGKFDQNGAVKLAMKGDTWLPDMFSVMSDTMTKLIDGLTKTDENGNTLASLIAKFNGDMSRNLTKEGLDEEKINMVFTSVDAVTKMLSGFSSVHYNGSPVTTYVQEVLTDIQAALQPDAAAQFDQLADLFSRIGGGFTALIVAVDNIDKLNDVVENHMAAKMAHVIADILSAFRDYLNTDLADVPMDQLTVMTDIIYKLGNAMTSISMADTEKFMPLGEQIANGIAAGIIGETAVSTVTAAIRGLLEGVNGKIALEMGFYDNLTLGEMLMNNLIQQGYDSVDDAPISEIMSILDSKVTNAGEEQSWSFQDVGYYLAAGIAVGVSSGTYLIENACRAAVAAARAAAMSEANAHSPSLVFAEIGGWLSQGMAIGITDNQADVITATTNLTDSAITGAADAMATFSSLMSQDIDANPTITPVMDLSNVRSGANYINGVLAGNRDLNLSTGSGGNYASDSVPRSGRTTGEYQGTDLTGVNARISELGSRLTLMGDQIAHMQIVLDSGELVGSISGGVSSNIGQKSVYRRRRNA